MHPEEAPVATIAARLADFFGDPPELALVLGSGLGVLVDRLEVERSSPFTALALPGSTVPGHAGQLHVGRFDGHRVAMLAGRVHLYEGHPAAVVVRYVRALHRWGVGRLLLTCSVGGIAPALVAGSLVLVVDHLNFQLDNPLVGPPWGDRFPDLGEAYDVEMRRVLHSAARSCGQQLHEGVFAAMPGPAYETPAEVRMLATLGADVVGMSTVPEVMAAAEVGLRCAVLAVVANPAAGLGTGPIRHDDVTEGAGEAGAAVAALLAAALGRL